MSKIYEAIAFTIVISLNVITQINDYEIRTLMPYLIAALILLTILFIVNRFPHGRNYFVTGITSVAVPGIMFTLIFQEYGSYYLKNIIAGLYLGLFLMALIPVILNKKTFTVDISSKDYPEVIIKSDAFRKINLLMTMIWGLLFFTGIILTKWHYSDDDVIQMVVAMSSPLIVMLVIGVPVTKFLPPYLMEHGSSKPMVFESMEEAFTAMPYGFNRKAAEGVNTVIQFELSGKEAGQHYLLIKDGICRHEKGRYENPDTVIRTDSDLWLDITNNKISGDKAYLEKSYTVEGDVSIMMRFRTFFSPEEKPTLHQPSHKQESFKYKSFEPGKIKKIVVFDGGPRQKEYSKTTLMLKSFSEGAEAAGAEVESIKLIDHKIAHCRGCFQCWTKTPGVCLIKDDMSELMKKYREADLVILGSPLFIFSVTGIMKDFMDRLLPLMKPYMIRDENGMFTHPDRFPEQGEQGFVVFSAGGFPDIKHNFDGLQTLFRSWSSHGQNIHLMGEFFLPAAEIIVQPVYRKKYENIKMTCYKAGKDVVEKGKIEGSDMEEIQKIPISAETFQTQADMFWENMDGKASYLKEVPKIQDD